MSSLDTATHTSSWAAQLDAICADPALRGAREAFLASAQEMAAVPIIRRVYRYEDLGSHRSWLDGRSVILEPEIQTTFALAMSDHAACATLCTELPALAAAYRLSGDPALHTRVLAQLDEMSSWSPLQRPGWSVYLPGCRLPADGKDGSWLATGTGVRALVDTLEIMPANDIPADLRAKLEILLGAEIAQVVGDWQVKRQWFVRDNNPLTNQWVLPTEGLLLACLALGVARHREAYDLAMRNMCASFAAHGEHGEFEEGYNYGIFTLSAMMSAARAAAVAGDGRLQRHRYMRDIPRWLAHHLMPGRYIINAFDCAQTIASRGNSGLAQLMAMCAICLGSDAARWMLRTQFDAPPPTLSGVISHALPAISAGDAPPLWGSYPRATRVNWRDRWEDDGSGVWVRGGHETDQHDHRDRGHLSFYAHGVPLLIEAGTPAYHNVRLNTHYASGVGHNVLQLGTAAPPDGHMTGAVVLPGWQQLGRVAPIAVTRLDATGGDITVDGTACYDGIAQWSRRVQWTADTLTATDMVALAERQEIILFRWHLGTEQPVSITGAGQAWTVRWPHAEITLESGVPISVAQEMLPDNTLLERTWEASGEDHLHTCLVVRSVQAVPAARMTMRIAAVR